MVCAYVVYTFKRVPNGFLCFCCSTPKSDYNSILLMNTVSNFVRLFFWRNETRDIFFLDLRERKKTTEPTAKG